MIVVCTKSIFGLHEALVQLLAKVKLGFTKLCEEEMPGEC